MANKRKGGGRKKSFYTAQRSVTIKHKAAGKAKREKELLYWVVKGVKKNGKPVLSLDDRKIRAAARLIKRHELKARTRQQRYEANRGYHTHTNPQPSNVGVEEAS